MYRCAIVVLHPLSERLHNVSMLCSIFMLTRYKHNGHPVNRLHLIYDMHQNLIKFIVMSRMGVWYSGSKYMFSTYVYLCLQVYICTYSWHSGFMDIFSVFCEYFLLMHNNAYSYSYHNTALTHKQYTYAWGHLFLFIIVAESYEAEPDPGVLLWILI